VYLDRATLVPADPRLAWGMSSLLLSLSLSLFLSSSSFLPVTTECSRAGGVYGIHVISASFLSRIRERGATIREIRAD